MLTWNVLDFNSLFNTEKQGGVIWIRININYSSKQGQKNMAGCLRALAVLPKKPGMLGTSPIPHISRPHPTSLPTSLVCRETIHKRWRVDLETETSLQALGCNPPETDLMDDVSCMFKHSIICDLWPLQYEWILFPGKQNSKLGTSRRIWGKKRKNLFYWWRNQNSWSLFHRGVSLL